LKTTFEVTFLFMMLMIILRGSESNDNKYHKSTIPTVKGSVGDIKMDTVETTKHVFKSYCPLVESGTYYCKKRRKIAH
jgi:hypothetical protein